ncbi:MAG: histidine kinase, partial [Verrucomicrobia bacterium]|nr:histidine kinase [Verrucomicrobiota bacterium]
MADSETEDRVPAPPPEAENATVPNGLPLVSPDEQEEELDDIVPTRGYSMIPLVGLGGSAGSIPALKEFFHTVRPDIGMAFVVVVHLAPASESILPQLLGQCTEMPVLSVVDGVRLEANHVYIIPPGKHLTTVNGHLQLTALEPEHGRRVAVDLFFRSLADTHGPHASAIVLSGADGDGAIGIKRIKERGGITIAQDPDEAEHAGMPRAAIATGMVDWILRVSEMPGRLIHYRGAEARLQLPPEEGPQPALLPLEPALQGEAALREVLMFLRSRTGHDFSYYKRATIVRRISRRMQINEITELPAYLVFLRTHSGEVSALQQDLLISVTNFFRDREAFSGLERVVPELFQDKGPNDFVRVWVPACATGEEAYSVAMLLLEHARKLDTPPVLQVFGCDLDDVAIQAARVGRYPDAIAADVSEDRLRRFFVKEPGGFRVRREVREINLFAQHDLLRDAPFSRLDLISCRNLLIYLNREAQERALDVFHFALRSHGLLFLGSSESVDEGNLLFRARDKKHRIYEHQPTRKTGLPVPTGPSTVMRALEQQEKSMAGPVLPATTGVQPVFAPALLSRDLTPYALDELHLRLVEKLAAPSVVVNSEHDVVHLSEHAGRFVRL